MPGLRVYHSDNECRKVMVRLVEKPKPQYKVGQIVVMKSLKRQLPFRIMGITWEDGWYYQWNKKNFASEGMIRELTLAEKGE
ncbi:MAG: hypothetical protein Q7R34_01550 [Dehalococcoidia bacterium]|nr:hypothetical protein [Dehalococcoidia bacterium]